MIYLPMYCNVGERKLSTVFTHLNIETAFVSSYCLHSSTSQSGWIEISQFTRSLPISTMLHNGKGLKTKNPHVRSRVCERTHVIFECVCVSLVPPIKVQGSGNKTFLCKIMGVALPTPLFYKENNKDYKRQGRLKFGRIILEWHLFIFVSL